MLEVILFIFVNVFLSDIFLAVDDVDFFSYAEDNIFNCASESTDDVILSLQDFPQKCDETQLEVGDSFIWQQAQFWWVC